MLSLPGQGTILESAAKPLGLKRVAVSADCLVEDLSLHERLKLRRIQKRVRCLLVKTVLLEPARHLCCVKSLLADKDYQGTHILIVPKSVLHTKIEISKFTSRVRGVLEVYSFRKFR